MIYLTGYDLWEQEIRDPTSGLLQFGPDVCIFCLDIRDLVPEFENQVPRREEATALADTLSARIRSATSALLEAQPRCTILCLGLYMPPGGSLGLLEGNSGYSWRVCIERYNEAIRQLAEVEPRFRYIDMESIVERFGWERWQDPRLWYVGRMRLSRQGTDDLAEAMARCVCALRAPRRKCLVLDLDNTLWGGVVGEDGLAGIKLGQAGIGRAFQDFQRAIKALTSKGVLLAISSKNNPEEVLEVFRKHPDMVLKEEDFTAMEIGWGDKGAGLRRIAERINIGLDSLVFWDDSPIERSLIRETLPEVLVPEVPTDPSRQAVALLCLEAFDVLTLTREDVRRTGMYREEARRRELKERFSEGSLEDFYRNCKIKAVLRRANQFTLPRLAQLAAKTNQFNLSTVRYSQAELAAMAQDPLVDVYSLEAGDRFGDLGVVGLAIVRRDGSAWFLDTFLLSCRALGRTLEHTVLGVLLAAAVREDAPLRGVYVPTLKNAPIKRFLDSLHLTVEPDGESQFRFTVPEDCVQVPDWIELIVEV